MKRELSILIPTYNDVCAPLVHQLHEQAIGIKGLHFEILVADDGSTEKAVIEANQAINHLTDCHYLLRGFNSGRSAIRNFLAKQSKYAWLLFIDGDMSVRSPHFLATYLESEGQDIVYGGYIVGKGSTSNLRYCYEKASEARHFVNERRKRPYHDFHTSNFMIRRELMLQHPFNERIRYYGYEDVLYGKSMRQHRIHIEHIDNPTGFDTFESNELFIAKTEEGLRTLHTFHTELKGYNRLLTLAEGIHLNIVKSVIRLWHRLMGPAERRCLTGSHPNLTLFYIYKIGYYLSLTKND